MNKSLISNYEIFKKILKTIEAYENPSNKNLIKLELNKRQINRNETIPKESFFEFEEINKIKIHLNKIWNENKKKVHINKLSKFKFLCQVEFN